MKSYAVKTEDGIKNLLADELDGYLVWPKSKIPFFDKTKLSKHADKKAIDDLINKASEGDEEAIEKLWCEEYLSICYKVGQ